MSDYEQTELDMRNELERKIGTLATDAVSKTRKAMLDYYEVCIWRNPPGMVRNRHEAYGHAAEQLSHIQSAVKQIGKDTQELLCTLSDPDKPALDAVSSIYNSTWMAAVRIITAAAEMDKIRDELYNAEKRTETDEYIDSDEFQEAKESGAEDFTGEEFGTEE